MMLAASGGQQAFPRAAFVGVNYVVGPAIVTNSPQAFTVPISPSGAQAGDYCLMFVTEYAADTYPTISGGSGGWTQDNYTFTPSTYARTSVLHKQLTALDISDALQLSITGYSGFTPLVIVVVYRGPTSAVRQTITYQPGATMSATGFTKSFLGVGVVALLADRINASVTVAGSISGGSLTQRSNHQSADYAVVAADALSLAAYPDGATVDWTGLSSSFAAACQLYELRA